MSSRQTTPEGRVYHRLDNNAIDLTTIFAHWDKRYFGQYRRFLCLNIRTFEHSLKPCVDWFVRMCKGRCGIVGVVVNVQCSKTDFGAGSFCTFDFWLNHAGLRGRMFKCSNVPRIWRERAEKKKNMHVRGEGG